MWPCRSTTRSPGFSGGTAAAGGLLAAVEPPSTSRPLGRRREDRLVGPSDATRRLIAQAAAAARTDLAVWIVGPPGGDHSLVARAVHEWGPRATRPLEIVSCAAVPEALQGRELFGCAAGVYPRFPAPTTGALERAAGGTLLLEDVEQLRADLRASAAARPSRRALPARGRQRRASDRARAWWRPRAGAGCPSSATCPTTRSASLARGAAGGRAAARGALSGLLRRGGRHPPAGFSADARAPSSRRSAGRATRASCASASARRCACAASP